MYIRNNYTLSDAFCQEGTERKAKAMVSRSLLAPELEQDDSKISVSPHYSSDQLTNLETISFSKQEDTQQTELTGMTTPQTPIPDAILHGKGLLINRNFAWLAIGQAISNLGDFVFSTTLFIWVFTLTHSAAAVSGVLAAQYIPVFLLGPLAGVFVDRWDRRQVMLISDLIRAGVATLPLLAPASLRLQAIYASVFLISAFGRFFLPAESGVLQVIVTEQQQMRAASIKQATFTLSIIVGPALASSLYFAVGPVLAVLINAVSYLVSAFCLARLRAPEAAFHPYTLRHDEKGDNGVGGILNELLAGLKFVAVTRIVLMVTLMALIAMLGAGALNALNIVFVSKNLHMATAFYGVVTAVSGLGGLLGIILAGILSRWIAPRRILSGSALLIGVGFAIYSFQSWYVTGLIICFLMSIPQGGIPVAFGPLLLNATPKDIMGRVQAVVDTSMSGVSLISVVLAGFLGQFLPVGVILAGCGIVIALAGLFGWFAIQEPATAQPESRKVERR
jgi:MFS family permease